MNRVQALVVLGALALAVVFGLALSRGPDIGALLILMVGAGIATFALPAVWLAAGGLVFILAFAVAIPVNAASAVLSVGPLGGVPLFAFLCAAVAGISLVRAGPAVLLRGGSITLLAVALAVMIATSTVANGSPDLLVSASNVVIWLSAFVLALCLPVRFIPMVLTFWVLLGIIEASYAIYEFIARPPVLYGSLLPADYAIGATTSEASNLSRAQGTLGHPIPLGTFLVTAFTLAMWAVKVPSGRGLFWLRIVVFGLLAAGALVTLSRSSWVVLLVVAAIGLASRYASLAMRVQVIAIGAVSVFVVLQTPLGEGITEYIANLGNTSSFSQRSASLQSVPAILGSGVVTTLFGFGAGSQALLYTLVDLQSVGNLRVIDNQYITFLAEIGLVGLAAFIGIMIAATVSVRRRVLASPDAPGTRLCWGIWVSLLAPLIAIFFYDGLSWPSTSILIWTMFGFLARFNSSGGSADEEKQDEKDLESTG